MVALVVEMVVVLVVAALVTVAQVVVAEDCEAKPKTSGASPCRRNTPNLGCIHLWWHISWQYTYNLSLVRIRSPDQVEVPKGKEDK